MLKEIDIINDREFRRKYGIVKLETSENITKGTIAFKNTDYTTYIKRFSTAQERCNLLCDWACNNDDLRESNPNLGYNETYIIIKES